jgi:alcohol dehydrogenase class IV
MNQKEYISFGAVDLYVSILANFSARNILLVTGRESYAKSGAKSHLQNLLKSNKVYVFNDFEPNPKIEDVKMGVELFREAEYDAVIAVGGGSVIDMAKMINFFIENRLDPLNYINGDKEPIRKVKPLIAIPTTAGSGSEATHFAVVYVNHKKHSIEDQSILPEVAIIDSELTMSLPPRITAISGMDALSQAIESYWSIDSTEESRQYAEKAIKMILSNLAVAVNNPTESSRLAMAKAAHLSGKAINITKTSAPHAISYPLTAYFDIPHGHAVALTLPSLLAYNYRVTDNDLLDERGCDYVRAAVERIINLLGAKNIDSANEKIEILMKEIGLETRLEKLDINDREDIEKIVKEGFDPNRVKNNPRMLTHEALREILCNIH